MDIGFIHPTHPASEGDGATYTATKLVTELVDRGHSVTVFCPRKANGGSEIDAEIRLLDTESRLPFNVVINHALRKRVDEFESFDVVHSYKTRAVPAVAEMSQKIPAATVVSLTAYGGVCPKNDLLFKGKKKCERNGYRKCARCAMTTAQPEADGAVGEILGTVSWTTSRLLNLHQTNQTESILNEIDVFHTYTSHVKDTYAEFGYPSENISIIQNILDERFLTGPKSDFREPIKLLYAGRLTSSKGVKKLTPILRKVINNVDVEVKLTIAGTGGLLSELTSQVERSAHKENVDICGYVPYQEMPALYDNHDIFLSPLVWDEPFGRTFLEALASGTPVVTADVGAAREIIGSGGVITDGTVNEMATSITHLINENRLGKLSKQAVQEVEKFRPNDVVPKFERLYREVES